MERSLGRCTPYLLAAPTRLGRRATRLGPRLPCRAATGEPDAARFDQAAYRFATGLAEGISPDELVAREIGSSTVGELTEVQDQYREKLREKLQQRARELEEEKAAKQRKFALGKLAYERGQYSASAQLLEAALNEEGHFSQLGGEVQLWLALAYQAEGRETECIELYKRVEATHPSPKIKKQAADLRYIMEAPRLQVSPEERISIPVLTNLQVNRSTAKPSVSTFNAKRKKKVEKSWEDEWLENYSPPQWARNYYVWVATTTLAVALAWWSTSAKL